MHFVLKQSWENYKQVKTFKYTKDQRTTKTESCASIQTQNKRLDISYIIILIIIICIWVRNVFMVAHTVGIVLMEPCRELKKSNTKILLVMKLSFQCGFKTILYLNLHILYVFVLSRVFIIVIKRILWREENYN